MIDDDDDDAPIPGERVRHARGEVIGTLVGPPVPEAEHFWQCELCGGYFDMRDLAACEARYRIRPRISFNRKSE